MFNLSRINRFWRLPAVDDWRQNFQKSPVKEVEDSILLRVLVLALVVLGIVATDVASESKFSLWAIPFSIVGTFWSYYSRRKSNIAVKFCIAIGMLAALGAFFGRFVGEWNDTRLSLAELLIQLQALHCFDTPRRKDLGYSIVIGLILLGVAATLSQTMAFAPLLLLFLAIALPTLVLDYRSRLGFQPANHKVFTIYKSSKFNFKFLIFNFLLIVGLGLAIFAVLPRFPGYQLRQFPVSTPIELRGRFTGQSIVNPGYVRQGNGNGRGAGTEQGNNGEPGKMDSDFYYGFNSQINQNLRGEMKPKVVMRVRSQAEGFWRVLAFDRYTGKGWEISRNDDVKTLRQSPWSYRIQLDLPPIATRTQEVVQTYTVVSDLPNLIPAMADPKEIFFPTAVIAVDQENGLRSPVQLSEGLTYTVVSEVPLRNRTRLNQASTKYPANIQKHYLQIPPSIAPKVKQKTEEILANYHRQTISQSKEKKSLNSNYEKALYLAQYLKQNYSIPENPLDLPYLSEQEDLVEAFLFKHQGGYPDHFSTVLTMMLRSIGIPARLVAGYAPGEFNPFTGLYVVKNTDAYAITEVYFPKYGWFTFDPIPNHPLYPPSVEDVETFSVLRQFWNWVAGWLPSPVTGLLNSVFGAIFGAIFRAISWFLALFTQGWFGVLAGLMVATALSFLSWLGWVQWRQWLNQRWLNQLPPMERLYQQMLQWTSQKGLGKHPAQTPLEYAQASYQHHPLSIAQVIDDICQAYVQWRYGGHHPDWQELQHKWVRLKMQNSQFKMNKRN
jgi:transglutaminase-like putative cysteine protease/predicted membrane protein